MNGVLHLGFPKTGTTFLQEKIFPLYCKEAGIEYFPRLESSPYKLNDDAVLPILTKVNENNMLHSEEWFLMAEPGFGRLLEYCKRYPDIKYIMSIRRQSEQHKSRDANQDGAEWHLRDELYRFDTNVKGVSDYLDYNKIDDIFKQEGIPLHFMVYEQIFDHPSFELKRLNEYIFGNENHINVENILNKVNMSQRVNPTTSGKTSSQKYNRVQSHYNFSNMILDSKYPYKLNLKQYNYYG